MRGVLHPLEVSAVAGEIVVRAGDSRFSGDLSRAPGENLVLGLKQLARRELPVRLHEAGNERGLSIQYVSIRDQRTRWGSCAASGRISLNGRPCRCRQRCAITSSITN